MDNNKKDITENSFFTRGCCAAPGMYHSTSVFKHSCAKLDSYDWLEDIPLSDKAISSVFVEVRFKNSKKDFLKVFTSMKLEEGDIVAVESSPGHDIGIVSLTGEAVKLQMEKKKYRLDEDQIKKVYRRARPSDIEKWVASVEREDDTMFKSRTMASDLNLLMKINDVEYQGDGTKAIFYYTAEERVDFRELIKNLADAFKVRIEMRQIGARQESARLGGIGSCGREVCCATWLTNFTSVTTNNARTQQLSLNPSKLAGQCGKLKCCLNYENDMYLEALQEFPDHSVVLKTKKGDAVYQKADVFKRIIWYSYMNDYTSMMAIPLDEVKNVIQMNGKGKFPDKLEEFALTLEHKADYSNGLDEEALNKFEEDFDSTIT